MLTWHLDRAARSATVCLLAATIITIAVGLVMQSVSDVANATGIVVVGGLVVGIGGIVGSTVTSGAGVLLIGVVATLAEANAPTLLLVGSAGIAALLLIDLSISLRRAPRIDRLVWRDLAINIAMIVVLAAALFGVAFGLSTLATWQAIVVPFGVLAIGFALRLGADAHASRVGP